MPIYIKPICRYRANLALALQQRETDPDKPLVFDEWTSELDRDLAKVVSVAFCKRMRDLDRLDLAHFTRLQSHISTLCPMLIYAAMLFQLQLATLD